MDSTGQAAPASTVPLHLDHNRPFIDIELTGPSGRSRVACFWVDTGGGGFMLTEPLARDLGLSLEATDEPPEEGLRFAPVPAPVAAVGKVTLDLHGARVMALLGAETIHPGVAAEGMLPGHVLARYHVIFDYPQRSFTLAEPGSIQPVGARLPITVQRQMGFPRIECQYRFEIPQCGRFEIPQITLVAVLCRVVERRRPGVSL